MGVLCGERDGVAKMERKSECGQLKNEPNRERAGKEKGKKKREKNKRGKE